MKSKGFEMIVMGGSFGGVQAYLQLLPALSKCTTLPIAIVQHIAPSKSNYLLQRLQETCHHDVREGLPDSPLHENTLYMAPPGYHMLIESNKTIALSKDERVLFSRPSIDVLFESAADVFENTLIAVLLTGANADGANGMRYAHELGALTIAQDPAQAQMPMMPQSAIEQGAVDEVLALEAIPTFLEVLWSKEGGRA